MSMFTNNKDDAKTILKQKKFSEGTLRYQRYKQAKVYISKKKSTVD